MKFTPIMLGLLLTVTGACTRPSQPQSITPQQISQAKTTPPFVTTQGLQFYRGDKPYHFAGTNLWYGANLAVTEKGRARLVRELELMKKLGVTNIRLLGSSEGPGQHNSVRPQFKPSPDQVDEQVLRGLDFVLAEMGKRDMTAVIYLNNFWIWSGGMSQYVSWMTGEPVPNPFDEEHSWSEFMSFSARFYANDKAQDLYRKFISTLVNRTNTVTDRLYRDDPTILSWQLANEPRPGSGEDAKTNMPNFLNWIESTADYIKSIDSNHLVSSGSEGLHGCNHSEPCYLTSSAFSNIDYLNMHIWILNWGWLDPKNMAETYPNAVDKALQYMAQHAAFATTLGKPITLEEFGAPRDEESTSPEASTIYRDKYFKAVFEAIYQDAQAGGPIAGSNFWAWGGEGRAKNPTLAVWHDGDDWVGDPPQEPQGLNSIFSSDRSTLDVISKHGHRMQNLTGPQLAGPQSPQ